MSLPPPPPAHPPMYVPRNASIRKASPVALRLRAHGQKAPPAAAREEDHEVERSTHVLDRFDCPCDPDRMRAQGGAAAAAFSAAEVADGRRGGRRGPLRTRC